MNDRQLTSFLKIVETGSFSKAAQESYISVPAMVQQIDRLEEDLGFRLFSRTNQGAILTEDGVVFCDAKLGICQYALGERAVVWSNDNAARAVYRGWKADSATDKGI